LICAGRLLPITDPDVLTPANLYQVFLANRALFNGPNFDLLALGLSTGIVSWAVGQPQNLALSGISTGVAGAGVIAPVSTRLVVPPTVSILSGTLIGARVAGPLSGPLATVVTLGVSQAFSTYGQYSGVAAGVGAGADVAKVTVANAATLIVILQQSLSVLGAGPALRMVAVGLGNGIAGLLLTGTGTGVVTGATVVPPVGASGITTSVVV
jgi:hypothetical protein